MEVQLTEFATGKIIYKNVYPNNFDGKNDLTDFATVISSEHYQIKLKEKWFDGIHIAVAKIKLHEPEIFCFQSTQSHIDLLFCLNGSISFINTNGLINPLSIKKNQQIVRFGNHNNVIFKVVEATDLIFIQLTESYFFKIINKEFNAVADLFQEKTIIQEVKNILKNIVNQPYAGRAKRLFLEYKIFELIIFNLNKKSTILGLSLKEEDMNKIRTAKKFVESDLQNPSSLLVLSRKAGINDYKLKKGFKELTGHTVFGYLYKLRMEKAHYYLTEEKRSVNEVSFLVGYKNAQHFISAFKKHYNILPGSLNKVKATITV